MLGSIVDYSLQILIKLNLWVKSLSSQALMFSMETKWQTFSNLTIGKSSVVDMSLFMDNTSMFMINSWLNLTINYLVVVFWVVALAMYLITVGSSILTTITVGHDNLTSIYSYFDEWEEELGGLDDSMYYMVLLGLTMVWFYFFTIMSTYVLTKYLTWLISMFTLVMVSGIIVPGSVVTNLGMYFAQYMSGSGSTTSIIFETLLDFMSVSVIVMSFFVQNISFVFIFLAFFELYEFMYNNTDVFFNYFMSNFIGNSYSLVVSSNLYYCDFMVQLLLQWVTYLYYLGHLTLLFMVQLSMYFLLSFWLFFFLYTTFLVEPHEKYFMYSRVA